MTPEPIKSRRVGGFKLVLLILFVAGPHVAASSQLKWGRIVNDRYRGQPCLASLFFAGPPNPGSVPLYTRHPVDEGRYDWLRDETIDRALDQMRSVGLNTIKLSYWGHDGEADAWAPAWLFSRKRWPGDPGAGNYSDAQQIALAGHFFDRAAAKGLLFSPMLEVSPRFPFYAEFPDNLDNMVDRCAWLVSHFGNRPNWLRLYDRTGRGRVAIWLIETIHAGPVSPPQFASAFNEVARRVAGQCGGAQIGFILSPTPLPANGTEAGPDARELIKWPAVLAICPGAATAGAVQAKPQSGVSEADRLANQERFLSRWAGTNFPLFATAIPGYDSHLVFPANGSYGFTPAWREAELALARRYGRDGVCIDCWNGWTEGYGIPPTTESGDADMQWARQLTGIVSSR
jgi:hypothetical protein